MHPLTAAEFRGPLDETLQRLPLQLLRAIAAQGYRLHVVDSQGHHPLTLELEEGEHDWQGLPVSAAALEFVTRPRHTTVAGMVLNGPTPGLVGEGLVIVLWDNLFRRGDGLTDWYVLHELGHATDFSFAFYQPEAWRGWRRRLEAAFQRTVQHITRYSGESPVEYFAEAFAAWGTLEPRGAAPSGLEELGRQRYALQRSLLSRELCELIEEAISSCA